jgi:hypothetical protein
VEVIGDRQNRGLVAIKALNRQHLASFDCTKTRN